MASERRSERINRRPHHEIYSKLIEKDEKESDRSDEEEVERRVKRGSVAVASTTSTLSSRPKRSHELLQIKLLMGSASEHEKDRKRQRPSSSSSQPTTTPSSAQQTSSSRPPKQTPPVKLPKDMDPEPVCPICQRIIIGDADEINDHIDECIGMPTSSTIGSGINSVMESGQNTPMTHALFMVRSGSLVNIDEDDHVIGKAQYTEEDIIHALEPKNIRKRALQEEERDDIQSSLLIQQILSTPALTPEIGNLQKAIRQLMDRISVAPKCSVCWDTLKMPASVSVNCWHACCEECWLRTLGTKRLCPHCSTITNPSDLRKIFF